MTQPARIISVATGNTAGEFPELSFVDSSAPTTLAGCPPLHPSEIASSATVVSPDHDPESTPEPGMIVVPRHELPEPVIVESEES